MKWANTVGEITRTCSRQGCNKTSNYKAIFKKNVVFVKCATKWSIIKGGMPVFSN